MGLFDKVKKILFDEEEIDDETLPIRTDEIEKERKRIEKEETEEPKNLSRGGLFSKKVEVEEKTEEPKNLSRGGVIFHNNEEDTITEVKVPVEKPSSLVFPVKVDDDDFAEEKEDTVQMRLKEDEFDRTRELEQAREKQMTRSKEELLEEYNAIRGISRSGIEPKKEEVKKVEETPVDKGPYKVPPVISPVFGVLDKNYDPDNYEETRQKITLSNSGQSTNASERQFGPVSYNDQGIPVPKYHKETVIITNDPSAKNFIKEELLREKETMKEVNKIEEEIINSIINDEVETKTIEDEFEETKEVKPVKAKKKEIIEEKVEEPTIELPKTVEEVEEENNIEDNSDEVITGSPYDDIIDEVEPTKSIDDLIEETEETEEADITPDAPKDIDENVNLDDTIETDLYNLIDSMYKDEE